MTILFADFAGFTTFVQKTDVEEVHETMGMVWTQLDSIILAHGGTVDKHMGDAVLAFFGEKHAREDAPAQAVRAGLAMQACIRELRSKGKHAVMQLRMGIHTGLVILEPMSASGEFRATGDAINLANRLEQNAPMGGVLISHDTFRIVYGLFDVQELPPLSVKGKAEPVRAYLVSRAKPRAVARQLRDIEGVSTEMVGRRSELERLKSTFQSVLEESESHVVTIMGEAGIGKSRLLQEFQRWAELMPQHFWFFFGQGTAEMPSLPFALVREVLAARFEIQDSDSPAVAREKLEHGVVSLVARSADATTASGQEPRQMAHFIGQLLGLDFSASPYIRDLLNDPEQLRDRSFYYLKQFFTALSCGTAPGAEGPQIKGLLLVAEDIHWSDQASLDVIDYLARECKGVPLMIVCLARPTLLESRPAWGEGLPAHTRLHLDSLSRRESRILVETILHKAAVIPPALRELIIEGAEGNPFYIEEIIKMLVDQGVIIPGAESWRIELERLAGICLPPTLAGVLQARLDGLTQAERAVLQRASVVGRVFWDRALESMCSVLEQLPGSPARAEGVLAKTEIPDALASLRRKELIYQREASAFAGATEFVFKHELLRNSAYESLLKKLRRGYHGQAADWLIEQSGDRSVEFAGAVAMHLEAAGRLAEAGEWYGRAGQQARAGHAPAMAIEYLRKALDLVPRDRHPAKHLEWLEPLAESLWSQALFEEATEVCMRMRCLAEELGDLVAQARAWNGLAFLHERRADNRASVNASEQAEKLARNAGESGRRELIRAMHHKGWALYRLADWDAVFELARQTEQLCTDIGERHGLATSLKLQGVVYLQRGEYARADSLFEKGLALYREFGDRRNAAAMWSNLGESSRLRGDFATAVVFYEKALAIARLIQSRESEIIYLSNLSGARLGLSQYEQAEAGLRELIPLASTRTSSILSEAYSFLAEACLGQGKLSEGMEAASSALTLARESGNELDMGIAWRLLGQLSASDLTKKQPQAKTRIVFAEPSRCFVESLALFKKLHSEGEQARTLRAWAQCEIDLGQTGQGGQKLKDALGMFQRLGMRSEVARTEALLREFHSLLNATLTPYALEAHPQTGLSRPNIPPVV